MFCSSKCAKMLESFKFLYVFIRTGAMYFDNFDNLMFSILSIFSTPFLHFPLVISTLTLKI